MVENNDKYHKISREYSEFVYESYKYGTDENGFWAEFSFLIRPGFRFTPKLKIPARSFYNWTSLSKEQLDLLIFNIGMIELISYWKCCCSPNVHINHPLSDTQIKFWKKLYFNGLGEFFYLNNITDVSEENFMYIHAAGNQKLETRNYKLSDNVIIPIGGGKDSVVTLEALLDYPGTKRPMIINPRDATLDCIRVGGFERSDVIEVQRSIDPFLLELNRQGFLNGHTPFSAMLAFVSLLVSSGSGIKHIALSNEFGANEPTVKGSHVNHQYSKSVEFERDFRNYVNEFISPDFNYFSFLRPLEEIGIARLFAKEPKYFDVFKSCNVGSKQDIWCCNCPKCLFAFIILSPYIDARKMKDVFGENLLDKESLKPYFLELIGQSEAKPFECVGTIDEVCTALKHSVKQYPKDELPVLLKEFQRLNPVFHEISDLTFHQEHFLNQTFEHLLKCRLN